MKVSFIGFGNMAMAMVRGLLEAKCVAPCEIMASAKNQEKLETNTQKYGVKAAANNLECAAWGDVVILAVKPYQVETVLNEINGAVSDKPVISLAVNTPFAYLNKLIPSARILPVMPNTPISVCQGILVCSETNSFNDDDKALLVRLFEPCAMLAFVPEDKMGIAGTLAGCTPAWLSLFMEALADAGVKYGLGRQLAQDLAAKVTEGTGKLLLESREHPGQLKDAVCSPAGTTIKGVSALEKAGFRGDVIGAVDAVMEK